MNFSPYHDLGGGDVVFLLQGAGRTIGLTAVAGLLASVMGLALGWLRFASRAARLLSGPFVDVLRSVPLLVLLILVGSFIGILGVDLDPFGLAIGVLTLYAAAFASEIARAGFTSVDARTRKAARALGKDTALVSTVGYVELMKSSQIVVTQTNAPFAVFAVSGMIYFAICYPCSVYGRRLETRMKHDLAP